MILVVDVVFPEGGESVEDIVGGGVRLGVLKGAIVVDDGVGGSGEVVRYLAAEMSGDPAGIRLLERRMAATLPMV